MNEQPVDEARAMKPIIEAARREPESIVRHLMCSGNAASD
jgi:hypothetical protein